MITCTSCGFEAADDFAFCPKCATALTAPLAMPEERKVVTTLFCDLVGFTAMSEAADPEDVDRLLNEYSSRARRVIESHGGTVEKFIGDAVVGVFGVPVAHEDDPERAVRAALRLLGNSTLRASSARTEHLFAPAAASTRERPSFASTSTDSRAEASSRATR